MSDPLDDDETLLMRLGAVLPLADPLSPFVTAAGRAAYSWRRIDAELAELLADSATREAALSGTRGASTSARRVSFGTGPLTIELEIRGSADRITLVGQLSPAAATTVQAQTPHEAQAGAASSDELGVFRFDLPRAELIRLRVRNPTESVPPWVQTSWIAL